METTNDNDVRVKQFSAAQRRRSRQIAVLVFALWAYLADARAPAVEIRGLVSIADGEPFTIIRGDSLWTGSRGATLVAGDLIETGSGAFLVVEMQGGSLVGIGPSSQVYFLQRADVATLVVLKGWVKADTRAKANSGAMRVVGTRLGIQGQQAVVLLNASEQSDEVFDEQGAATLLLRDRAATRMDKETKPNQFFSRQDRAGVILQPHPSADFVATMPIAFRDALPEKASASLKKPAEPKWVRNVTYSDLQPWLTMPGDWRAGFIGRFRGRLKDPAFFSALDAHLALHPEWVSILHPRPRPQRPLAGSPPGSAPTPHY
jgi:hypothetical protein